MTAAASLLAVAAPVGSGAVGYTLPTVTPIVAGCGLEGSYPSDPPTLGSIPPVSYGHDATNVKLDGTVVVSPPSFRFGGQVAPRTAYACTLTIRNRRETRTTFQLETMGVVGTHAPNAGYEFVGEDDDRWDSTAGPWITPAVREVTLDPREVARVPFRIEVPDDPPAGSAIGSINVVSRTRASAGDAVVGVESQVASVVLVPTGGGSAKLALHDVHAPRVRWDRESWPFTADLDNDGRRFASAAGRVRVRSIFGNEVASLPVPRTTVLPGGREAIDVAWKRVPWLGIYRWDVRVASDEDGDGHVTVARRTGWIVALPPWWVLVALGALVVALIAWWRRRLRRSDPDLDDDSSSADEHFDFDLAERQLRDP